MIGRGLAAASTVSLLLVGAAATPAHAAAAAMTLSSVSGPSGGGNTITATFPTTTANPNPIPTGTQPTVQFQYSGSGSSACGAAPKAVTAIGGTGANTTAGVLTVNPADVQPFSTTRLAVTVPSASYPAQVDGKASTINTTGLVLAGTQTSAKWFLCVYDAGNTLIGTATYTIAVRPHITSILPTSSPAFGSQLITVNGVGFTTTANGTTASISGSPLKDIKVSASGTSFTGVTTAHLPGTGLTMQVTTQGGPVSSNDPDNNGQPQDSDNTTPDAPILFTYSNGISVTPASAPAGAKVNLDVRGVGFDILTFNKSTDPTNDGAHVFLVKDAYVAASNRGVQECTGVKVVGSTELICTLDLTADRLVPADSSGDTGNKVAEGTYTVTVVANGSTSASDADAAPTIVSTGSTFTVAPY